MFLFFIFAFYFFYVIIIKDKGVINMDSSNIINKVTFNDFIMIPINLIKYFLLGVVFFFVDLPKSVVSLFTDPPELIATNPNETIRENVNNYQKYKFVKKTKKQKKYKYSQSFMKKLEAEKALFLEDLKNDGHNRTPSPLIYVYKVRDKNGKVFTDSMSGLSKLDINGFLLSEGYEVFSIKTSKWINIAYKDASFLGNSSLSSKDLIFFLNQLSTYLKAGLPLSEAMNILSKQMNPKDRKSKIYLSISFELSLGEDFSAALEKQKDIFPALLINMIKAAEASGNLHGTLEDMIDYYSNIDKTKKQMISAITYPCVVLVFANVVIAFILIYVIPQFTDIYIANDSEITGLTKFIMDASAFLSEYMLLLIILFFVSILTIIILCKKVKVFRTVFQIMMMKTYILKDVIIYNEITIFSKTFASLLRNNVYITDSVDILSKITSNEIYKGILFQTIDNIVKGENISDAFEDHWAVPDVAYYMMVTGENTGDLANMMQKVSDYYQEEHKSVVNNLKALVEPILTTFLAVIVGIIIIAVIVPMYGSLNELTNS